MFNLDFFNRFDDGQVVNPKFLAEQGWITKLEKHVKVLGDGELKKKIDFEGLKFSESAKSKIAKIGGNIING